MTIVSTFKFSTYDFNYTSLRSAIFPQEFTCVGFENPTNISQTINILIEHMAMCRGAVV